MQSNLVSTPLFLKLKKIQGLFKDLHRNSRTFQGKMEFKDFSRTPPKIQGLFKTVRTLQDTLILVEVLPVTVKLLGGFEGTAIEQFSDYH